MSGAVWQGGDSQLMVMPSSTPRLLGSFTWKVPLLGMTDSGYKQMSIHVTPGLTPILVWLGRTLKSHCPNPILLLPLTDEETKAW